MSDKSLRPVRASPSTRRTAQAIDAAELLLALALLATLAAYLWLG